MIVAASAATMSIVAASAATVSHPGFMIVGMDPITITISCDTCTRRHSDWCRDCLVTAMCTESPVPAVEDASESAIVLDLVMHRALRLLAEAGLVPELQHREAM